MTRPWLSVIVPTFNGTAFLRRTLDSIATQTDADLEVIAIDDGSTDDTVAILHEYQPRMNLVIEERRVGNWAANSNYGLQRTRGEYACFLHQDDYWLPGRQKAVREALNHHPNVRLLLHACEFVDPRNITLGGWTCPYPPRRMLSPSVAMEPLLVQNFVGMPGAVFHRATALAVDGLDESLWYTADWDLWLKLAAIGPTVYLPRRLAAFRLHPGSQTASRSRTPEDFRHQMQLMTQRHIDTWPAPSLAVRHAVKAVADASIEINMALAAAYHRQGLSWRRLMTALSGLSLSDWHRLQRDSRLGERVMARLRAGFVRRPPQ